MKQSSRINVNLMKDYNKQLVLRTIQKHGPISRVEIANRIELSRPSVSEIVSILIEEQWIEEKPSEIKVRGRQPIPLDINKEKKVIVGLEIGAYATTVIVCNLKAEILYEMQIEMNTHKEPDQMIECLGQQINSITQTYKEKEKEVLGIGVGMHGLVDTEKGKNIFAPNLGWRNVEIQTILENITQLKVLIDNDCNSAALAEMWFGQGKDESNFISVIVDYGVGASIINGGSIFKGAHHVTGQIGHVTIDPDGPLCSCGNYGCLETLTSEKAILKKVKRKLKMGETSHIITQKFNIEDLTIEDFYQAVNQGDELCLNIAEEIGRNLGLGFTILINLFGPKFIVLGGSLTQISDVLIPNIMRVIQLKVMGEEAKQTPIVTSALENDLYTIGAASLIVEDIFSLPNPNKRF
ncbi:ROK family transcriptional regulator [Mammaliicoccus vitulinus]|uniref:ROK family transcriptional regulator n=1 Tax=Mammaliicoccus vitulinus TaxID=71237 RepID=UPI00194EE9F3|nr:ROK family transcriptional regulator [Mammaliicoccus vitulinus]MBM6630024.1 ROK family transcriptional regulator [Mammaliicoccus vitulinus]MBO3076436.1 ROK family transcriptional regulator [Mammaliicoccus vitulinus]WQK87367.1 ROK family transcriptional regulator [Mammaliicoccus vitulinus]